MPTDAFALPVGVGRQIHRVCLFRQRLELGDHGGSPLGDFVAGLEVGRLHAHGLLWQVAHMAHAGGDVPAVAEDGFELRYLSGRFDNHQFHQYSTLANVQWFCWTTLYTSNIKITVG